MKMTYAKSDDEMLANSNIERGKVIGYSISQFSEAYLSSKLTFLVNNRGLGNRSERCQISSVFKRHLKSLPRRTRQYANNLQRNDAIAKVNDKNIAVIRQLLV